MFLFCLILLFHFSGNRKILSLFLNLCFCFVSLSVFRGCGKCQVLLSKFDVSILFDFTFPFFEYVFLVFMCPFFGYSGNVRFCFQNLMFLFCLILRFHFQFFFEFGFLFFFFPKSGFAFFQFFSNGFAIPLSCRVVRSCQIRVGAVSESCPSVGSSDRSVGRFFFLPFGAAFMAFFC